MSSRFRIFCLFTSLSVFAGWVTTASAQLITYRVTVQPIHVTNGSGDRANNGNEYYEAVADRIFAQIGVDIAFLTAVDYENATWYDSLDLSGASSGTAIDGGGGVNGGMVGTWNAASGNAGNATDGSFLRLFFVHDLDEPAGTQFGATGTNDYVPAGFSFGSPTPAEADYGMGVVITDDVFSANRIDTIAHEIGHALAISTSDHLDFTGSPWDNDNLLANGSSRNRPNAIDDIFDPVSGTGVNQLDSTQTARLEDMFNAEGDSFGNKVGNERFLQALALGDQYTYSTTAVPEPASTPLIMAALGLVWATVGRRRR